MDCGALRYLTTMVLLYGNDFGWMDFLPVLVVAVAGQDLGHIDKNLIPDEEERPSCVVDFRYTKLKMGIVGVNLVLYAGFVVNYSQRVKCGSGL